MNTQEIIVYLIIAAASFVAIRSLVKTTSPKAPAGGCNSCAPGPSCGTCLMKDIQKKK